MTQRPPTISEMQAELRRRGIDPEKLARLCKPLMLEYCDWLMTGRMTLERFYLTCEKLLIFNPEIRWIPPRPSRIVSVKFRNEGENEWRNQ